MANKYVGAGKSFASWIDLLKHELRNAQVQNLASAPSAPVAGQIYFDTGLNLLRFYDGTQWVTAAGAVSSVAAADTTATITPTTGAVTVKVAKTLDHTYVTDFDTQVRTSRLDQMAVPSASVSMGNNRITSVSDPSSAQDAATKAYVDAIGQGLTPKAAVKAATTAPITLSSVGLAVIDGYQTVDGDRVLVKNQSAAAENGIYLAHASAWTRATDMDAASEVAGAYAFVLGGTTNIDQGWIVNSFGGTLGSSALTWTQFTGVADITTGTGLAKSGNTISLSPTPTYKYATSIGDGAASAFDVTHNLGTTDVVVSVYDISGTQTEVDADVTVTSTNVVHVVFGSVPASGAYRVVCIG